MNPQRTTPRREAFTLIEILVVIAIIGILVAALLPAFGTVRTKARMAQGNAQFLALDQGLESFRGEQALGGAYPPSASDNPEAFQVIKNPQERRTGGAGGIRIAGAHLLGHALIGADQLGPPGFRDLDRDGLWWNDTHDNDKGLYELDINTGDEAQSRYGGAGFVDDKMKETAKSLKDLEDKGLVVNLDSVANIAADQKVFVDPWDMPILYYNANSYNKRLISEAGKPGVFRQEDNGGITGTVNGSTNQTGLDFGPGPVNGQFHAIANAKAPLPTDPVDDVLDLPVYDETFARFIIDAGTKTRPTPVNRQKYLLISAGVDGRYGTSDDITNWKQREN